MKEKENTAVFTSALYQALSRYQPSALPWVDTQACYMGRYKTVVLSSKYKLVKFKGSEI